jgi:hypothetical protein
MAGLTESTQNINDLSKPNVVISCVPATAHVFKENYKVETAGRSLTLISACSN